MKKTMSNISKYLAENKYIKHWIVGAVCIILTIMWTLIPCSVETRQAIWWIAMIPMTTAYIELFVAICLLIKKVREEKHANKY